MAVTAETASARWKLRLRWVATLTMTWTLTAAAFAEWRLSELSDPTRDQLSRGVFQQNERGFRLEIVELESGGALAVFRLARGSGDFLDPDKAPILRIGDALPLQVPILEVSLTWVAFPVWSGDRDALTGTLRDLMSGEQLEISYYLEGGGYKQTVFTLSGAAEVIAQAFEVPVEVDPAAVAAYLELESVIVEEGVRCSRLKGKKREKCLDAVRACRSDATTAQQLRSCLSN